MDLLKKIFVGFNIHYWIGIFDGFGKTLFDMLVSATLKSLHFKNDPKIVILLLLPK